MFLLLRPSNGRDRAALLMRGNAGLTLSQKSWANLNGSPAGGEFRDPGPPPSRTAAVEQAKYYAYKLGAGGITNLQYGNVEGTS